MAETTNRPMSLYLQASLMGAIRGAISLAIEHPFDTVKTRCQANISEKSVQRVMLDIVKLHGFKGLYSGCIPNGVRLMVKQAYRWPMMLAFPQFFKTHLPQHLQNDYPSSAKLATALSIAHLETFIICPLERLKVYLMTADRHKKGIIEFYQNHQRHIGKEVLRGIQAVYLRQITAWVSFLLTDEKLKNWEKKRIQKAELPFTSLMKVSFCVGVINTAMNMPFDVVKTQMQKAEHGKESSVLDVMKKIYRMNGVSGLYTGWQVRMIQYMVQSVFTVSLLDHLERRLRNG
jgi:hypothetical protein